MREHEDQGEPMGAALEMLERAGRVAAEQHAPVMLVGGVFSIYAAPKGGLVLVTEIDGKIYRKKIPGPLLKMLARGPLGRALRRGTDDGVDEQPDQQPDSAAGG